ncbi:MAG: hypothetical protein PW788_04885 [Micavibrio sp.]|nr:hypothetical protein [Micavibrio sp.]
MRIIGLFIAITLLLTGFSSAAQAFGAIVKCPNGMVMAAAMNDCCNDSGKTPAKNTCAKCDVCCAVTAAITPASIALPAPAAAIPEALTVTALAASTHYPHLRPPNIHA